MRIVIGECLIRDLTLEDVTSVARHADNPNVAGVPNLYFDGDAGSDAVFYELVSGPSAESVTSPTTDEAGHETVDHLVLNQPGLQTPEEYEETVRDLVTFLQYLGEPAKLKRKNVGIWVLLFLAFFTMIAYLLKLEYWRDVH